MAWKTHTYTHIYIRSICRGNISAGVGFHQTERRGLNLMQVTLRLPS